MVMKKIAILAVFFLFGVYAANGQVLERTVLSDELHFAAYFPEQPQQSESTIDTGLGQAVSRRWTLESPDVVYEILVVDFSQVPVAMDPKPLNQFYDSVRRVLAAQHGEKYDEKSDTLFGEYGRAIEFRAHEEIAHVRMHLVQQRLYQVRAILRASAENDEQTTANVKNFLEGFVFVQRKENEGPYSYGLPQALSQNLEGR